MNDLLDNVIFTETNEDTNSRNTIEYHTWREAVLKRDRNTCQCCGETNDLQVHHIKNFSSNI
jgi:hypothetical protein